MQRRQLRVSHADEHFCAAQFRYMKELAMKLKDINSLLLFCDDKAKIPLGEPGCSISTGVRGKKCIAPCSTTVAALDHDVSHKGCITPSVYMQCSVPDDISKSFYRGAVTVVVNDSVFQSSNPFRHAAALVKQVRKNECSPSVVMKFSDGGTDQRNTLEAVKVSLICVFRELNVDLLIAARCAPGQSWTNPVKRVMSILNIGLQNCALERTAGCEEDEKLLKPCGGMDDIRKAAQKDPRVKDVWQTSVAQCLSTVANRLSRLSLKSEPVVVVKPTEECEIESLQRHIAFLFPTLDKDKLTKVYTSRNHEYVRFIESHCRERQYSFQIRKCTNVNCCGARQSPEERLHWLPDPMLDPNNGEHFLPFSQVYGTETTERDRPTLNAKKATKRKININSDTTVMEEAQDIRQFGETSAVHIEDDNASKPPASKQTAAVHVDRTDKPDGSADASLFTAQHAQAIVCCVDCRKPRIIYCKQRMGSRQLLLLATQMSEYEYTCGSPASLPNLPLYGKIHMRINITCESKVEIPYYSLSLGRADLCCHCGEDGAIVDADLKKSFKTVLPLCEKCSSAGEKTTTLRPYGKKSK